MVVMAKEVGLKIYFRTTPKLRGFYNRLTGTLRATEVISSKKGYTSNDAIINALLLWAAERDPEELARTLQGHIEDFEGTWGELLASGGTESPASGRDAEAPRGTQANSSPVPLPEQAEEPKDETGTRPVWTTGSIRQRTEGDNANLARQNQLVRDERKEEQSRESASQSEVKPSRKTPGRKGKTSS